LIDWQVGGTILMQAAPDGIFFTCDSNAVAVSSPSENPFMRQTDKTHDLRKLSLCQTVLALSAMVGRAWLILHPG